MNDVRDNCRRVLERIQNAAVRKGRSEDSVRLIAVTKAVSAARVRTAVESGVTQIGENRLQEALPKRGALCDLPITWHFIGHLQTNKARKAAEHFDWVQSVDRLDLADKLNRYAGRPLSVLVEVKLDDEPAKSGVTEAGLDDLVAGILRLGNLRLRGFMAIPPFFENPEDCRPYFRRLRQLASSFSLPELSMGMSHDFEIAVEEGATMVRIGTAIFGTRL